VEGGVLLGDGHHLQADHVIAATGALAPGWLARSGLSLDSRGYVAIDACHQSSSHKNIFAAGDICSRTDVRLVRSGVHAVHAGPILARNLLAAMENLPLKPYIPRRRSLYLLASGDGRAVASWGPLSAEGAWVWRWKDRIDRHFIRQFSL
jgi:NADH dehydrogenase FAD-containing subunit